MSQNKLRQHIESLFRNDLSASSMQVLGARVLASLRQFATRSEVRDPLAESQLESHFRSSNLPGRPLDAASYVGFLEDIMLPHSVNLASPYCLGHMTGTVPTLMPILAQVLVCLNQNLVKREASLVFTIMERQTLAMLHRLIFGRNEEFYDRHAQAHEQTLGAMTSCGTLANLTALWCARNSYFPSGNGAPSPEVDGLAEVLRFYDYEKTVILGSSLMHYSIEKAAGVLGLGSSSVIKLPVDKQNRLSLTALQEAVDSCERRRWRVIAIVAVAGTTECGTVDSIEPIAEIARRHGIHLHVDAAWGGPLLFSEKHRSKLDGIQFADSVTIDGHKQFYVPIGASALVLRSPLAAKAIELQANYILRNGSGDLGKVSLEGSRPGTSLFLHAALHLIGQAGYEYLIDENIEKANVLARSISESSEFELLASPETNIVVYRFVPEKFRSRLAKGGLTQGDNDEINVFNAELQQMQYEAGKTFVSRTTLVTLPDYQETPIICLRAVIVNPLVRDHHLKTVLHDQARLAQQLEQTQVAHSL